MKLKISKQFKAALLIVIFSMNTVIGFACSVGIDMVFNSSHHQDEEATETMIHVHSDGKKHVHHEEAKNHDEKDTDHHEKSKSSKDNCCNEKVIKFNEIDKSASQTLAASITPLFFVVFIASFNNNDISYTSYINTSIKYFVRSYHPPISDIRIAIRSFQI
jgi:hypothetical protein